MLLWVVSLVHTLCSLPGDVCCFRCLTLRKKCRSEVYGYLTCHCLARLEWNAISSPSGHALPPSLGVLCHRPLLAIIDNDISASGQCLDFLFPFVSKVSAFSVNTIYQSILCSLLTVTPCMTSIVHLMVSDDSISVLVR